MKQVKFLKALNLDNLETQVNEFLVSINDESNCFRSENVDIKFCTTTKEYCCMIVYYYN
jgi:hypothetical protein